MRTRPTALFGAAVVVALLLLLPMRLALGGFGLGEQGLTARAVSGSVWSGRLREARFGDIALGDLDASLSPLALLVGRARVSLTGHETAPALHGAISVSRHGVGIDDLTATLPTGRIFAPVPVTILDFDDMTAHFRDGQCDTADGRVRATLGGDVAGMVLAQSLAGTVRCDAGALLVPLASQGGTEGVTLRIFSDGRYRAEFTVTPADAAAAQKLETMGFVAAGSGYRQSVEGQF